MKRRLCPKCKNNSVIYSACNPKTENKPFRCNICDTRYTYKQIGAVKTVQKGYYISKDPERLKRLSKALFNHCAKIMSDKRKMMKE